MRELERNRPMLYREEETRAVVASADEAGRDINALARAFNSGYGTVQQLGFSVHRLAQVVERFQQGEEAGVLLCGINAGHAYPCETTDVPCLSA